MMVEKAEWVVEWEQVYGGRDVMKGWQSERESGGQKQRWINDENK